MGISNSKSELKTEIKNEYVPQYYFKNNNELLFTATSEISKMHDFNYVEDMKKFMETKTETELNDFDNLKNMKAEHEQFNKEQKEIYENEKIKKLTIFYGNFLDEIYEKDIDMQIVGDKKYIKGNLKKYILESMREKIILNQEVDETISFSEIYTCPHQGPKIYGTFFREDMKYCEMVAKNLNEKINSNKEKYKLLNIIPNFLCKKRKYMWSDSFFDTIGLGIHYKI